MPDARKGSTKRPLAIDGDFFARLANLIDENREVVCREIADDRGMPVTKVRLIADGKLLPKDSPYLAIEPEEFEKAMANVVESNEIRSIQIRLESALSIRVRVTYPSGVSTSGDGLDEAMDSMNREPEAPELFSVHVGLGSRSLNFFVMTRASYSFTTATYEVEGNRRDVDHFSNEISAMLRSSEPDHRWLHSRLTSMTAGIAAFVTIYVGFRRLMAQAGISDNWEWPGILWGAAPLLALALQYSVDRYVDNAYPKVQYEFGSHWRRMKARRTSIYLILTAVALPLLISFVITTFQ